MVRQIQKGRYLEVFGRSLVGDPPPIGKIPLPGCARRPTSRWLLSCMVTLVTILTSTEGSCSDDRTPQQVDPTQSEGFLNCDRRAEVEAAEASRLTPVAPVSILNPVLLLNDLHRRKQEEENQPRILEQIELKRQQCRREIVAAASYRAQEALDQKTDAARGYRPITFEAFALDAKSWAATQKRVSVRGAYLPDGNLEWLFPDQTEAIQARSGASNIARIPLVTEDASREFRKALLRCKSTPGSDQIGCRTLVTGHVSLCSLTTPLGARSDIPCIIVENGRETR
jgi:DNA-directed RNA polymerase subunit N (RpoN/RPB10)